MGKEININNLIGLDSKPNGFRSCIKDRFKTYKFSSLKEFYELEAVKEATSGDNFCRLEQVRDPGDGQWELHGNNAGYRVRIGYLDKPMDTIKKMVWVHKAGATEMELIDVKD